MPPLADDEYQALRADIAARGVLVPIIVDQYGRPLDGHHRRQIADELGIDCPAEVREVADDSEALDIAYRLNLARRQLDQEQKRQLIAVELTRDAHRSDRAIGRLLGVDGKTVGVVRHLLDQAARERAEQEARERQQREDDEAAAIASWVKEATGRELRLWAAWVAAHDRQLAAGVLEHWYPGLEKAAAAIRRRFGCADLGCHHAPPGTQERQDATAEFPQLPTPPVGELGPYSVHPVLDLFPLISGEEFAAFVRDVATRGLLVPITLTADRTTMVDGRIRYLACQAAGIEPTYQTLPADWTAEQIAHHAFIENSLRVHLTAGQRAMAAALVTVGGAA